MLKTRQPTAEDIKKYQNWQIGQAILQALEARLEEPVDRFLVHSGQEYDDEDYYYEVSQIEGVTSSGIKFSFSDYEDEINGEVTDSDSSYWRILSAIPPEDYNDLWTRKANLETPLNLVVLEN